MCHAIVFYGHTPYCQYVDTNSFKNISKHYMRHFMCTVCAVKYHVQEISGT